MDSTLFTIYAVVAASLMWALVYAIKVGRSLKTEQKPKSVKESLFGKKKRKAKKENWSFAD
jgi:hypothetical protein